MNRVFESLKHVFQPLFQTEHGLAEADEAYLAASVDVYDLERRMEALDRRVAHGNMTSGGYFDQFH
jgi:hypothetical protein